MKSCASCSKKCLVCVSRCRCAHQPGITLKKDHAQGFFLPHSSSAVLRFYRKKKCGYGRLSPLFESNLNRKGRLNVDRFSSPWKGDSYIIYQFSFFPSRNADAANTSKKYWNLPLPENFHENKSSPFLAVKLDEVQIFLVKYLRTVSRKNPVISGSVLRQGYAIVA